MIAVNDPGSTRLVYAMVIGLVVIGVALVLLGVWLVRQTRYDPPVLAPLERMGDDSWRQSDPATQRRILDEVRPEGAEPLATGTAPPTLDAEFDSDDRPVPEFDDLRPGLSVDGDRLAPPEPIAAVEGPADAESPTDTEEPVENEERIEVEEAETPSEAGGPAETEEPVDSADSADVETSAEVEESTDTAGR